MPDKPKILLVEDEFIIALALAEELQAHGFEVAGPYTDAEEAAASLGTDNPDAAFLDVNLGHGRTSYALGLTLLERGTPFVFLTGYSEFAPEDQRLAGVKKIGKPLSESRMIAEAERLVERNA